MLKWPMSFAVLAILAGGSNLLASNLVLNPGFESLTDDWMFISQGGDVATLHGGVFNSGSYSAFIACFSSCNGSASASISQTISTNIGDTYSIDFALSPPSCCLAFAFQGGIYVDFGNTNLFTWTLDNWTGTFSDYHYEVVASSLATEFTFHAQGLATGGIFLDDISIVNISSSQNLTPEPSTGVMLTGGLAGLVAMRRRLKGSAVPAL